MKKKNRSRKYILLGLGAVATAAAIVAIKQRVRKSTVYQSFDLKIPSKRLTDIVCTINLPQTEGAMPLVIFTHGFGADRHEGGRFTQVADKLATKGIASIRMDFSGCNESTESFTAFAIRNLLDDLITCVDHMINNYDIDQEHMGIVGYSMGGRLATLYSRLNPNIKTMALWAPALTKGMSGLEDSMGGADKLNEMIKEAQTNGSVKYNDLFGGQKELSKEYFMDMEAHDVLKALSHYKHNLLIVQGNEDDIVRPDVIDKALTHINKECHFNYLYMDHANHGFGLWDDHPEQSEKLVKETIKFIERHL